MKINDQPLSVLQYDVIIVGAGLSGIGAAYHVQHDCPNRNYLVLEGRESVGYTNATWTLKCDLNCTFVTRVLNYLEKHHYDYCIPRFDPDAFTSEPLLDFDAGYVKRALDILPKQGSGAPWKIYQNYIWDLWTLKYSSIKDKYLEYR